MVLLDGLLVKQMPKGPSHRNAVLRGLEAFRVAVPAGWSVWPEQPIVLRDGPDGDSAPEPDLVVLIGNLGRYETRHPESSEVGLVVEVASDRDAVRVDRAGLFRYAFAGIPITCIVNLPDRALEVYSDPTGPGPKPAYRSTAILKPGQSLAGEIGTPATGPAAIAPVPVESFFAPI